MTDFLRLYSATSRPMLADAPTVNSINTVAERGFAGFTHVTGIDTYKEEGSEVYNVSLFPDSSCLVDASNGISEYTRCLL